MPFGLGPFGWAYISPYWNPWAWRLPWYSPYWSPWAPLTKEQETAWLKEQANFLETQLTEIKKRLEELQK